MLEKKIESARRIIEQAWAEAPKDGHRFFLFSGGKDSIVASHLANRFVGLKHGFSESCLLPQYTKDDIDMLIAHFGYSVVKSDRLKPQNFVQHWDNQICNPKWKPSDLDSVRHWKSIPEYAKSVNAGLMLFGRRREENTIPKPIYYKRGLRALQVHPIWDWTRDEVWAYIKKNNLPYPRCYNEDGAKHLFTWVSLAHQAFKKTGNRESAYDVIMKFAPEFMHERAKTDGLVSQYLYKLQNGTK